MNTKEEQDLTNCIKQNQYRAKKEIINQLYFLINDKDITATEVKHKRNNTTSITLTVKGHKEITDLYNVYAPDPLSDKDKEWSKAISELKYKNIERRTK